MQVAMHKDARVKRPWTEYIMSQENLRQYLQMLTDNPKVIIMPGSGSSHNETGIATVEVGTVRAATTALHESLHMVDASTPAAWMCVKDSAAERIILNVLRDGAMERQYAAKQPGTRVQFQFDVDDLMPSYIRADWLTQATIGLYLLVGGYDFPEHKFKPEARDVLARFRPFITPIRKAKDAGETVQYVKPVLALFNHAFDKPEPPQPEPSDEDEDGEDEGLGDLSDSQSTSSFIKAMKGGAVPIDLPGAGGDEGGEDDDEDGEEAVRDAMTYNVDDAMDAQEAYERTRDTDSPPPQKSRKTRPVRVRGKDTVLGGPTANALEQNAAKVVRKMEHFEKRRKENAEARTEAARDATASAATVAPTKKVGKADIPKANLSPLVEEAAKVEGERGKGKHNSQAWLDIFNDEASVGYAGRRTSLPTVDRRVAHSDPSIVSMYRDWASTSNYLSRQLRSMMQTAAQNRTRSHERHGVFDTRRAYALGLGRFDVFRQPPAGEDTRACVVLTVDRSSSMGVPTPDGVPSLHAFNATSVVAGALSRIGVPFEVQGFNGHELSIYKSFSDPMDDAAATSLRGILITASLTPAGEALAFAWVRALTRPEPRRIVFMVTDGGVPKNTADMVRRIESKGGIAVGIGIGTPDMSKVFTRFVAIKEASRLPAEFERLLREFIPTGGAR